MTSRTFHLDDTDNNGPGAKVLIAVCCLLVVVVVVVVIVYAYKGWGGSACDVPPLDENGLSNWTRGADTIAFACLPGFFLESHSNVQVSKCVNGSWGPASPACNYLPLRLDCEVNYKGLYGKISTWQKTPREPANVYGVVHYEEVDRSKLNLVTVVELSKANCNMSSDVENVTASYSPLTEDSLEIQFNSTQLKAYNKADVHINLIFVNQNTTASLVYINQDWHTFVLTNTISFTAEGKELLEKLGLV